jgi:hypothetical protein
VTASGGPTHYEIRVQGVLDSRWAAWFDGLQVSSDGEETVISGLLADLPALHGLLAKVRDLGLCLISVRRLDTSQVGSGRHDAIRPKPEPTPGRSAVGKDDTDRQLQDARPAPVNSHRKRRQEHT